MAGIISVVIGDHFGGGTVHRDFLEREGPSGLRREKNQQQSQVRLNFKVFNDVDNRANALDKKQETNIVGGKTEKLAVRK